MKKLAFIKTFFSPFKRPKLKWYCGGVTMGTPYFLPRRWVKPTRKMAEGLALKKFNDYQRKRLNNPKIPKRSYGDIYEGIMRSRVTKPKKIGFDFVGLGYKTKWSDTDYRFEWSPMVSFVFFGLQITVSVIPPEQHHYWEAWLFYENNTDKTKSPKERIKQCKNEFPLKCSVYKGGDKVDVDYYELILK